MKNWYGVSCALSNRAGLCSVKDDIRLATYSKVSIRQMRLCASEPYHLNYKAVDLAKGPSVS